MDLNLQQREGEFFSLFSYSRSSDTFDEESSSSSDSDDDASERQREDESDI